MPGYSKCESGHCLSDVFWCDGEIHCKDLSDEIGCGCTDNEFQCDNGRCMDKSMKVGNNYLDTLVLLEKIYHKNRIQTNTMLD